MSDTRFRRNPVTLIWIGGGLLAVVLYVIGPEHFVSAALNTISWVTLATQRLLADLFVQAFDAVRALAVALFVVFVVLGIMAAQRGQHVRATLLIVSVLYVLLLWPAAEYGFVSSDRWIAAFLLAGIGAAVMTRRLTHDRAVIAAERTEAWR